MSSKKDEQIDLYIAALTTRDPSKRQIKPINKEAFQLFEDFESGSDEDFVCNSDDESEENEDAKENSDDDREQNNDEDDDENKDVENYEEEDSDKSDVISNVTDVVVNLGIRCNDNEICDVPNVTKCKLDTVMICMICLLDVTYSDNEIIECDGCGVVVHEDCYKICDNVFMSCDNSDSSTDPWFCDACLNNVRDPRCELCPVEGGVFKRTENNCWVHLQCALYTPGVAFNDIDCLTEITLSELPLKEWSGRECCLCTNPFYAKTGVCISCDAGLCKNFFHVLCAQREGLLSEPNIDENPEDPYFAQCQQHTDKDVAKRRRKNWIAAVNRQKLRLEAWNNSEHFSDVRMLRKLEYFSSLYQRVRELAPTPFVSLTKVPCYLETNPVSVFLFKKKAINLHLSQDVLNSYTTVDTRSGNGVPVFSPDFISYFLDREKRIDEMNVEIARLESFNRDMKISEQNTSHQFNKVMAKKEEMSQEYKSQWDRLNTIACIVKHIPTCADLSKLVNQILSRYTLSEAYDDGPESMVNGDNETNINNSVTTSNNNMSQRRRNSIINECCKCKSVVDQHLMIDCDGCTMYFHLNCLEPPLPRMPKKTKLFGWQCSTCGRIASDDEQKPIVDINKPRQLRKMPEISHRYKRSDKRTPTKTATDRLLQNSKNIANKITKNRLFKRPVVLVCKVDDIGKSKESEFVQSSENNADCVNKENVKATTVTDVVTDSSGDSLSKISTNNPTQRRSHRPRKRPLTLLDEFETPTLKKARHSKVILKSGTIKTSSVIVNSQLKRKRSSISYSNPVIDQPELIKSETKKSRITKRSQLKSSPIRTKTHTSPTSIKPKRKRLRSISLSQDSEKKTLKQTIISFPNLEKSKSEHEESMCMVVDDVLPEIAHSNEVKEAPLSNKMSILLSLLKEPDANIQSVQATIDRQENEEIVTKEEELSLVQELKPKASTDEIDQKVITFFPDNERVRTSEEEEVRIGVVAKKTVATGLKEVGLIEVTKPKPVKIKCHGDQEDSAVERILTNSILTPACSKSQRNRKNCSLLKSKNSPSLLIKAISKNHQSKSLPVRKKRIVSSTIKAITFFPGFERPRSSLQKEEEEEKEVRIGVVAAKKPMVTGMKQSLIQEKKPVKIKWHGDLEDLSYEKVCDRWSL